jgi:hypothetical protein
MLVLSQSLESVLLIPGWITSAILNLFSCDQVLVLSIALLPTKVKLSRCALPRAAV